MPEDEKTEKGARFVAEHRSWTGSKNETVNVLSIGIARTRADGAEYVKGWHVTPGSAVKVAQFLQDHAADIMREAVKVDAMATDKGSKGAKGAGGVSAQDVATIVQAQMQEFMSAFMAAQRGPQTAAEAAGAPKTTPRKGTPARPTVPPSATASVPRP